MADIQAPEQRVRKRRRRAIACAQCRSRKLKCDREYPTCGRCIKSKTPTKCSYEDGFLWQQPSTVDSSYGERARASAPASTQSQMLLVDQPAAHPTPDSGISSSRPQLTNSTNTCPRGEKRVEKRDRFLETVLGAPKAAVNQDFMNSAELLHRHRLHPADPERADSVQDDEPPVSSSQPLDLSPRIMLRGKDTKTRYNGSGIFANLIAQVGRPKHELEVQC